MKSIKKTLIRKSFAAGVIIGMAGFAYLSVDGGTLGAFLFSVGLLSILAFSLPLYTGRICFLPDNLKSSNIISLAVVLIMNLLGAFCTALIAAVARPTILRYASSLAVAKIQKPAQNTFFSSVFCGALICVAVYAYNMMNEKAAASIIVILAVMAFILTGSEHCIADMFLCPVVVYPKEKIAKIAKLIKESESEISKQKVFESIDDMFADMGINIDNV